MAIATDRLHTIVTLDAGNYQANAARVAAATARMKAAGVGDPNMFGGIGSFASTLGGGLATAAAALAAAAGVATAALVGLGAASVRAYADLERMALGLQSIEGSAEMAAQRMKELRELAKAPGLGFSEAVGAFGQLRNTGASAGFSQAIIREIANANARGGGDSATFARLLQAVSQSLNAPFLQGDEMRQFRENRLPVDSALKARFGTSDTEQLARMGITASMAIQGIVEEFSKMERVQGGFTTGMENLTDQINIALAAIGQGLAPMVIDLANSIGNAVSQLEESGVLKLFGEQLGRIGQDITDVFTGITGGADGLALTFIELGGTVIDLSTVLKNVIEAYKPENLKDRLLRAMDQTMPPWSPVKQVMKRLVGNSGPGSMIGDMAEGSGAQFVEDARKRLEDLQKRRGMGTVTDQVAQATEAATNNPVQQRQLAAMEATARSTAELVRIEQTAFGGGDILRRGISMNDVQSFNRGGGRGSNVRENLYNAIEAMIAQSMARGTA